MSGAVDPADAPAVPERDPAEPPVVELTDAREARVGRVRVRRALPRRGRRTVGPWCFADHMGPELVTPTQGLDIGPHPHTGLHTVTWLLSGEVLHKDSLGTEQVIKPGQLNLMTAGEGVQHSEENAGSYRGPLHGVQLWVAQPEATRHGPAAFEHHADLPRLELARGEATVLIGGDSAARQDVPTAGVDLALRPGASLLPLTRSHEYALVVTEGAVEVDGVLAVPGRLAYLGRGRDELELTAAEPARALLLGGEPFGSPVLMWWNFVARSRDELAASYRAWQDGTDRFGRLRSDLPRIPAPGFVL